METSRTEEILKATINGTEYGEPAQSRIEALLLQLKEVIEQGGGSSVTVTAGGDISVDGVLVRKVLTQAQYDVIGTPDPRCEYLIVEDDEE